MGWVTLGIAPKLNDCMGGAGAAGLTQRFVSLQSIITRVTAAHDRELLWASNEAAVLRLQALLRGFLARRRFAVLRRQQKAAVRIQVGSAAGSVSPRGSKDRGGGLTLHRGRFGFGSGSRSGRWVMSVRLPRVTAPGGVKAAEMQR